VTIDRRNEETTPKETTGEGHSENRLGITARTLSSATATTVHMLDASAGPTESAVK
jgi:hypothetical protein